MKQVLYTLAFSCLLAGALSAQTISASPGAPWMVPGSVPLEITLTVIPASAPTTCTPNGAGEADDSPRVQIATTTPFVPAHDIGCSNEGGDMDFQGPVFGTFTATFTIGAPGSGADVEIGVDQNIVVAYSDNDGGSFAPVSFAAALPVDLVHFSAMEQEESVVLEWVTASEENNDFFTVERSFDGGVSFDEVAKITGAGDSQEETKYSYVDEGVFSSTNQPNIFYRLKQTDFDGQFAYSEFVSIRNESFKGTVIGTITDRGAYLDVTLQNDNPTEVTVSVYNSAGSVLAQQKQFLGEGVNNIEMSMANINAAGVYILNVTSPTVNISERFFKQ